MIYTHMPLFEPDERPFSVKSIEEIPEEYEEYRDRLAHKMAIIDDTIYCSDRSIIGSIIQNVTNSTTMQTRMSGINPSGDGMTINMRPKSLGYMAHLIINNGKVVKSHL